MSGDHCGVDSGAGCAIDLTPAIAIIRQREGCRLEAYGDGGGLSIGWGHHADVQPGQTITQEQADQLLEDDVSGLAHDIIQLLHVDISNNELCALVSFAYNLGIGTLEGSTLLKRLNGGWPRELVANQFELFVHSGGHVMLGLVRRREAEKALFLKTDN